MKPAALVFVLVLGACASDPAFVTGRALIEQGRVDEGLQQMEAAAKANPGNIEYRAAYLRERDKYLNELLSQGDKQRLLGKAQEAERFYRRALGLDSGSARALSGLAAVQMELRHRQALAEAKALAAAGDAEGAQAKLRLVLAENPSQREARALARALEEGRAAAVRLKPEFSKPVTLEFRDAPLKSVFEVLARTSGINFVFDRDVRPDLRTTIYLRDTAIGEAVNFLLVTNQLEKKVLNENTILIYPNLPNKARDYQELMVKSFYLANADVKQTLNLIKTVVKTRDVFIDERLNLLVMRDTPEAIRLAEKLIAAQDLAEPEVMLELEVLEIARNRLLELGIRYPTQAGFSIQGAAAVPGQATLRELQNFNPDLVAVSVTDPALLLNMRKQDGDTNLLANPRIRVKNREKAKIHIGDRLPVITTTSTANVGVSESVQYLDVGLKLDLEPNVYLDDEVAMKVGLEVSNIVQEIRSQNGTLTYRLGSRNTSTVLRLKNGETQVLAGLIQDEDRRTADKVPGLGDLPLLGRLFGSRKDERNKTEIVLLITPYVVRNLERPAAGTLEFMAGTEGSLGAAPLRLPGASLAPALPGPPARLPAVQAAETAAPAAGEPRPGMPTVLLSAPLQVQAGREFAVAVSVPPGAAATVRLDLLYEAAKLQAVGVEGTPGRVALTVSGSASVRLRALEGQSGATQVSIGNLSAVGPGGDSVALAVPAPVTLTITP